MNLKDHSKLLGYRRNKSWNYRLLYFTKDSKSTYSKFMGYNWIYIKGKIYSLKWYLVEQTQLGNNFKRLMKERKKEVIKWKIYKLINHSPRSDSSKK